MRPIRTASGIPVFVATWLSAVLVLWTTSPALAALCSGSDLQGTVFRDYNADGARSAGNVEPGIGGVVLTAWSDDGSSASCETLTDGSFGIDAPNGFPVRVEATLPSGVPWDLLLPGAAGLTTTFFATAAATGLDVGFNEPLDYCQANPDVLATCFLQGNPLFAGSDASTGDTVVAVDYDRTVASPVHVAGGSEVGAVWGMAYQRSSQSAFVAAALRRHAGFGPLGLGGIYRIDYSGGGAVVSSFVDVGTIGISVGTDPRSVPGEDPPGGGPTGNEPGLDNLTYEEIGKVGLGDLDVEEEAGRLWVMNLADGNLYSMDIGPAGNVPVAATQWPLPAVACTDGVFRPWAVKSYRGRIYVGGVCSNETISPYPAPGGFIDFPNLVGYVYSVDPTSGVFSLELTIALNYPKGCAGGAAGCQWYPWTDLATAALVATPTFPSHPTPLLSDIEFADDGDMIVGFTDRTGFQYGSASPLPNGMPTDTTVATPFTGGDMLRADFDPGSGTWTLESNGIAGGVAGAGSGNAQGPGGGEYYSASTAGFHFELSQGGYAVLRGSNHFVGSAMDPVTTNSGGLLWMFDGGATPGATAAGYTLFDITTPSGFRKSAAVGDVELRCDAAPLEIGNRVWDDTDLDGVQDPGEPPLPNVDVTLDCPGLGLTATTATDASGLYLFTDANVTGGVPPLTACELQIDPADPDLGGRGPTVADAGTNDLHDSDGALSGGLVRAALMTGGPGANQHAVDFGFGPADLVLTKAHGGAFPGGTIVYTLTATNVGVADAQSVMVTDNLPADVQGPATSGCANDPAGVPVCDLGTIPAGGSAMYTITGTVNSALPVGTLISNTASVSSASSEATLANNSGSADVTLAPLPSADLSIFKDASPMAVEPGDTLLYTMTVTNNSPTVSVPDVVATDVLPAGVTLVATVGCAEDPAGVPTCTLGALGPMASVDYTIEVTVDAVGLGTVLDNTVLVSSALTTDGNSANDTSSVNTTVGSITDVPTLDTIGLLLMSLLLLGVAVRVLRRV